MKTALAALLVLFSAPAFAVCPCVECLLDPSLTIIEVADDHMLPTFPPGSCATLRKGGQLGYGDVIGVTGAFAGGSDALRRVVGLPGDTVEIRNGALFLNGTPVRREATAPFEVKGWVAGSLMSIAMLQTDMLCHQTNAAEQGRCLIPRFVETLPGGAAYPILNLEQEVVGLPRVLTFLPLVVPEGTVFVLIDNRDTGRDSRTWGFDFAHDGVDFREGGAVPLRQIIGRLEEVAPP